MASILHMLPLLVCLIGQVSSSRRATKNREIAEQGSFAEVQSDQGSLLDSWQESANGFMGIARGARIFKDDDKLFTSHDMNRATGRSMFSESASERARQLRLALDLSADYGFFTGSSQTRMEQGTNVKTYYYRSEEWKIAQQSVVRISTEVINNLGPYMTQEFKDSIRHDDLQSFIEKWGDFYVKEIGLGARAWRKVEIRTETSNRESRVQNDVQAQYDALKWSVGANVSLDLSRLSLDSSSTSEASFEVLGGDSRVLLSYHGDNWHQKIDEWAETVHVGNVVPIEFKLEPLWTLVAHVSKSKSAALQTWYDAQWKADEDREVAWNDARQANREQPGVMKHSSGMCWGISGHNVKLKNECSDKWKAIPVTGENQGQGGHYIIRHERTGKCLHIWLGKEFPGSGADLTIHKDCNKSRRAIWWKPECENSRPTEYLLRHYGGKCVRPENANPRPKANTNCDLGDKGCSSRQNYVFFQGINFPNDEPC